MADELGAEAARIHWEQYISCYSVFFFLLLFFLPFLVSFFSFLRVAFNVPRIAQVRSSCIQNRLITCMPPVTPPVRHLIAVKEPSLAGDTAANTTMVQQELVGVVSGAF